MGCIVAEMAHVWEGPDTDSNDIGDRVLFKGNSCYPYSPVPNIGNQGIISSEDQLTKIFEVIDV
jgi:hypothetical protein